MGRMVSGGEAPLGFIPAFEVKETKDAYIFKADLPGVKVLVDGNRLPTIDVLAEAVIGGDAKIKAISAASILAKVHRDRLCQTLHDEFPHYGFASHKGYATPEHLEALRVHGACRHHRKFFNPVAATFVDDDGIELVVTVS